MNLELTPSELLNHIRSLALPYSKVSRLHSNSASTFENNAEARATSVALSETPIKILIAYSGGLDSHVLLHLLASISQQQFQLRAIYINHGLQEQAKFWATHCQQVCKKLAVTYTSVDLKLSVPEGESIEEYARNARYNAIKSNLQADEILVTGHHQNDQAETLLLQLFRGSGVKGLASMPEAIALNTDGLNQLHLRPFLSVSRGSLEAYAKAHSLDYIEDPSNQDTTFDRNFLRQDILPRLRARWSGIDKTISRSAAIQAETQALLDEFAAEQLPNILSLNISHFHTLMANDEHKKQLASINLSPINLAPINLAPINIMKLSEHSKSKQRLLLRYWISQQGFLHPSEKKIEHIFTDLIHAANDKQPLIEWGGVQLRRYQQHLYIMSPLSEHDASQEINWQVDTPLLIDSLSITLDISMINVEDIGNNKTVTIKFRQGGEKINIPKRGNVSVKNIFQELSVPPWLRSRLPFIYVGDKLVNIVGVQV